MLNNAWGSASKRLDNLSRDDDVRWSSGFYPRLCLLWFS